MKKGKQSLRGIFLSALILQTFNVSAQESITESIIHTINSESMNECVTVNILVCYSLSGVDYCNCSTTQTLNPGDTANFSVRIPGNINNEKAIITSKQFIFRTANHSWIHLMGSDKLTYQPGTFCNGSTANLWSIAQDREFSFEFSSSVNDE